MTETSTKEISQLDQYDKKLFGDLLLANGAYVNANNQIEHFPASLLPTPFPRRLLSELQSLQFDLNELYYKLSEDKDFLHLLCSSLSNDAFIQRLYLIYFKNITKNPISFTIFRSDYMLDHPKTSANYNEWFNTAEAKMVEINTISPSLIMVNNKIQQLYKSLNLIESAQDISILFESLKLCLQSYSSEHGTSTKNLAFLMVTGKNEYNLADQMLLISKLKEHGIKCFRLTFDDIDKEVAVNNNRLFINGYEIAIVYYRHGYSPDHYNEQNWHTREVLEYSTAVNIPNVAMQIVGSKKSHPLVNKAILDRLDIKNQEKILFYFSNFFILDEKRFSNIISNPEDYVLKPQREGGGNNIFGQDIIDQSDKIDHNNFIAMKIISSPPITSEVIKNRKISEIEGIGEVGIFGLYFKYKETTINKFISNTLRLKDRKSKEGGIMVGCSVLSTPNPI